MVGSGRGEPLEIPAAWRGSELLGRPDWQLPLDEEDIHELVMAIKPVLESGRAWQETSASDYVMPRLAGRLSTVQHDLEHGSGAAMIKGFPVETLDEEQAACAFWAMMCQIGTAVSQTATGQRFFHVRDEGFRVGQSQARGPNTRKRLSFHTDRCDVIAFLCLRQARQGGENQLVSSVTLYNEILHRRPDLLDALLQPLPYLRHNVDTSNTLPFCRQPVFSFREGHFAGCFLRVLVDRAHQSEDAPDCTPEQIEAMDFLEEVAEENALHVQFRQQRGDILLVNNWVNFHRRFAFEDHEDPALRRHLLRIWLAVPNSRPLDPVFIDNYGATGAGAIRGGMQP